MQLLIDEHLSPRLVQQAAAIGVFVLSVPHAGLGGKSDPYLWRYAFEHGFTVVTTNARDFIELLDVELHPGLIILRESALSRQEQWERLEPVLRHILATGDPDFMVPRDRSLGSRRFRSARSACALNRLLRRNAIPPDARTGPIDREQL